MSREITEAQKKSLKKYFDEKRVLKSVCFYGKQGLEDYAKIESYMKRHYTNFSCLVKDMLKELIEKEERTII